VAAAAAIGVLVPLGGLDEGPLESQNPPTPMWGAPESAELDSAAPATLALTFAADREVPAARVSGVVTATPAPGAGLETGDVIYEVDGAEVFAVVSDVPLHAPVVWGDHGPDVTAHGALLEALGYLDPVESAAPTVDAPFLSAVHELAADLGYPDVGSAAANVFSHLVWVPADRSFDGYEIQVRPGVPAPIYPAPVLVKTGPVVGASVVISGASDREWLFENEQISVAVGVDGRVTPASLGALDREYVRGDEPAGILRLADTEQVWLVPASAVIVGSEGAHCVIARHGSIATLESVEIANARIPGAALQSDLAGSEVLLNAALVDVEALIGSATCSP
jgi:hypothetical protein